MALDIVDHMCGAGLALSIEMLHSILRASEESFEFQLVCRILSASPTPLVYHMIIIITIFLIGIFFFLSFFVPVWDSNLVPSLCLP